MANQNGNNACAQWDDRCMMTDLLDTAKHITEVYGAYVCEGSSDTLRQVLQNNMDATANDQFQIFQQKPQRVKNQPFLDPLRALPLGLHLRVGQMKALDGNRRELRLRDFMVCDLSAKIGQPNLAGAIPRCDQIERPPILAGIADQITASGPPRQIYINGILGIVGQRP